MSDIPEVNMNNKRMIKIISSNYPVMGIHSEKIMKNIFNHICDGQPIADRETFSGIDFGDEMKSETFVECQMMEDTDGRCKIFYDETDINGIGFSNVEISYNKSFSDYISIIRRGSFESMLCFEKNKVYRGKYHTPYMDFGFVIYTLKLDNKLYSNGSAYIDYLMAIDGENYSRFTVNLSLI